jgi:hypothetical protein
MDLDNAEWVLWVWFGGPAWARGVVDADDWYEALAHLLSERAPA